MSTLVRVCTPPGESAGTPHKHEGMIICRDHLRQIVDTDDAPDRKVVLP